MTKRSSRITTAFTWAIPLAWAIPWAVFRGEYAHGGYVWWGQVHVAGLLLLIAGALILRTIVWWRKGDFDHGSVVLHCLAQVPFVVLILLINWISFQVGLARHLPVNSLRAFLEQVP